MGITIDKDNNVEICGGLHPDDCCVLAYVEIKCIDRKSADELKQLLDDKNKYLIE